jgi:Ca-activated chloride channel family protein
MPRYGYVFCFLTLLIYFIMIHHVNSQTNYNYIQRPYDAAVANMANRENVLIILDSSYSMSEEINGERKIDIAKRTINKVLSELPPNVWVGLRVYGHKTGFFGFSGCRASELKVAIGSNNQPLIANELLNIKPVGMTPITYSIEQALNYDFNGLQGKNRIILVSDGMETCNGSPCDYAIGLVKRKIDLKIDVIGFNISEPAALSQLKCTALSTKGKFYTAGNAGELAESLSKSLNTSKEVQGKILTH